MSAEIRERLSDAEMIDQAITDLALIIGTTAIESEASLLYAPVLSHLVKARRALRAAFGMEDQEGQRVAA
jgi:hypothetical protein